MRLQQNKTRHKPAAIAAPLAPAPIEDEQKQQMCELLAPFYAAAANGNGPKDFFQALTEKGNPLTKRLQQLLGFQGHELAYFFLSRQLLSFGNIENGCAMAAFEAMSNLSPESVEQAMLALQMTQTFFLTENHLRNATTEKDFELLERRINLATKLSRLFLDQSAAFARMQGRSTTQKIVVEKLNVEPGAQAAIGVLSTPGTGGGGVGARNEIVEGPHEKQRCGAKNRAGNPCQRWPLRGRTRCRLHGGLSTGPRTAAGRQRCAEARTRHGYYTRDTITQRKKTRDLIRECRQTLKELRVAG